MIVFIRGDVGPDIHSTNPARRVLRFAASIRCSLCCDESSIHLGPWPGALIRMPFTALRGAEHVVVKIETGESGAEELEEASFDPSRGSG